jgi:hypothetical protein
MGANLQCPIPVQMLDVHEELRGDITGSFLDFDLEIVFERFVSYVNVHQQDPTPPELLRELLTHLHGFPCVHLPYRRPLGRLRPGT